MRLFFILLFAFLFSPVFAQETLIDRMEPPFWWAGMKSARLQLMVHGHGLAGSTVTVPDPGILVQSVASLDNPNYLFVNLELSPDVKAGHFDLFFSKNKKTTTFRYELKARETGSAARQGFDASDVIYLVTPDRFVNGNPANDNVEGMKETANRADFTGRHGGDIRGMINSLDYLKDIGFTAIWINPVLENNMTKVSYHGYSTTDFYKIDPRYGSNEEYLQLKKELGKRDMKLIMDMIFNHCGSEHWWVNDMPARDWFNFYPDYQITNHRRTVNQDPHASEYDKRMMADGWFVPSMPDLNHHNPFMATYLIQNAIWWTEYAGLDGIRMDTYPYPDKKLMAEWTRRMLEEYPDFNMVGEEWSINPAVVSYWQEGKQNSDGYRSWLPGLMDFPLHHSVITGLNEKEDWGSGLIRIYEGLANDFLYPDAGNLVIFPDNHDMSRIYTQLNENDKLFRLATAFFLTTRGIPQIFYGTEILMSNPGTEEHGVIRSDFPGGWEGDKINAFTGEGLSEKQHATKEYFRKILNWRKNQEIIHYGKLKHYVPQNGIYVYFRYNRTGSVMVVLNKNDESRELETARFAESMVGYSNGTDILSGTKINDLSKIRVPGGAAMIIELKGPF
ncbi:MAG: glycoside hydrolase family 13 protein [Prolixibacteraceae bacterium]|jgi:glycosidase|nr:glycoside hydrolase family 13 protein [Prolixibacteraceae bacterium]